MTFQAALAARIFAALAFALVAALAAVSAPAWALVMIVVAGAGVCLAGGQSDHKLDVLAGARGGALGVVAVAVCGAMWGLGAGLAALVVWRAAAEAFAAEDMLRDLAHRMPLDTLDRGPVRAAHLIASPVVALALLFGFHGGLVFGHETVVLPLVASAGLLALCGVALMDWLIRRLADWRMGVASRALTLHVGAYHLLFLVIGLVGGDGVALVIGLLAWRLMRYAPPLPGMPVPQRQSFSAALRPVHGRAHQAKVVAR